MLWRTVCHTLIFCVYFGNADDVADALGLCTCDLTVLRCDINCCCDTDCSSADRQVFSQCMDAIASPVTIGCNKVNILYSKNAPILTSTSSADSILCVSVDNYASRKYYKTPSLVTTSTNFDALANTYRNSFFNLSIPSFTGTTANVSTYQKGDPIYLLYTSASTLGRLTLPKALSGSVCNFNGIAGYLTSDSSTCTRALTITSCPTNTAFNFNTYVSGYCVLSSSKFVSTYLAGTTTITQTNCANIEGTRAVTVTCKDQSGTAITCNVPNNNGGFCNNIVTDVAYEITYNPADGIQQVKAQVKLGSNYTTDITQKFSIAFTSATVITSVVARSGNPGYLAGYPLLVGSLPSSENITKTITDLQAWTVPSGGDCLTSNRRTTVLFGQNIRSGCIYKIGKTFGSNCSVDQLNIKNVLRGTPFQVNGTMRVATWGNASTSLTDDWIPVLESQDATEPTGSGLTATCSNLIVGANVDVLFARVGSMAFPQHKIVGVRYNYLRGNVKYLGNAATYNIEIAISVNFVDTSSSTTKEQKQVPVFLSRLPYDFFYPFFI